jgi:hypothetical protein
MSDEPVKLFTPETLKDEYHHAFNKALKQGCWLPEVESIIQATRTTDPDVYLRLAALAFDYGYYAMRLGVLIYLEAKGLKF